jgi:hypothetical protein
MEEEENKVEQLSHYPTGLIVAASFFVGIVFGLIAGIIIGMILA